MTAIFNRPSDVEIYFQTHTGVVIQCYTYSEVIKLSEKGTTKNPMTVEPTCNTKIVFVYGITDEQLSIIEKNIPIKDICVKDCSGCFTDIIAKPYIAVIINPDLLTDENIDYFNGFANDMNYYSEKIVFTKPHPILEKLNKKVTHIVFADDFEFADKIKFILLEAHRAEKRAKTYSDTLAQTIRVLSEIRKHPYITTAELARKIERNPRTVQRYINTLVCAGEFIEYDKKKKGWYLFENKSELWGDW